MKEDYKKIKVKKAYRNKETNSRNAFNYDKDNFVCLTNIGEMD